MPPPRRKLIKISLAAAILFLVLPLTLILAGPRRTRELLHSAIAQVPGPSDGDLQVSSSPVAGEVYVDGSLRGVTPLIVELPSGKHAVRVGSIKLGRWRAAEVTVRGGVEYRLDVNFAE